VQETPSDNLFSGNTVDPEDIGRFDALAEEWWNPSGAMRPLHLFTPIRVDYLIRSVRRAGLMSQTNRLDGLKVLDIGCGGGLLAEPLAQLGAEVTAIDASHGAIQAAKAHAAKQKLAINYQHIRIEEMAANPENNAAFDLVYASEVIEHVTDRPAFITAMAHMLKPDGVVAVTTINKSLPALLLAKIAAEYVVKMVPAGTHQFSQFVSPQTLQAEFEQAGIVLDDITGFVPERTGGFKFGSITAINYGASGQHIS